MTEYCPTIIDSRPLIERLAIQLTFLREELRLHWIEFKTDPRRYIANLPRKLVAQLRQLLARPYVLRAISTAIFTIAGVVVIAFLIDRAALKQHDLSENEEVPPLEVVYLDPTKFDPNGLGLNGAGRVGFNQGTGEGSLPTRKSAHGGGGGGDDDPLPPQVGELPQPSEIQAPIPTAPPINPPALPVAGIDLDPALWRDLKQPVYGEPVSTSFIESKGPGTGDGIGTNRGQGVGSGDGPGVGPGNDGNMGDGSRAIGGGGNGGGGGAGLGDGRSGGGGSGIDQRARLLLKPEPQYTEEARRNQVSGTVVLRVVFSSAGEVVQIRAVHTLPFGLTERAIAAARQIKFDPALKDGRPVSVFMQLEYNFNLY